MRGDAVFKVRGRPPPATFWPYLDFLWRHKLAVYRAGRQLGVGRWRLLRHDLSKFRPDEFDAYRAYFYGEYQTWRNIKKMYHRHPGVAVAETNPTYQRLVAQMQPVEAAFDRAWWHHQRRNSHHWQYWLRYVPHGCPIAAGSYAVLVDDDGRVVCLDCRQLLDRDSLIALEMPEDDRLEMLADWMGAGMATRGHGLDVALERTAEWYLERRARRLIVLGARTRAALERDLGVSGGEGPPEA